MNYHPSTPKLSRVLIFLKRFLYICVYKNTEFTY